MVAKAKTRKMPPFADRILKAARANDENTLVQELEKITEMMGNILSGMDASAVMRDSDEDDDDDDKDNKKETEDGMTADLARRVGDLEKAVAVLSSDAVFKDEDKEDDEDEDDDDKKKKDTEDRRAKASDEDGDEDESETTDRARRTSDRMTADSHALRGEFQDMLSKAEILVPGFRLATFDAAKPAKMTMDAMCSFRRKVLKEALLEDNTKDVIQSLTGPKPDIAKMTCDSVQIAFNAAANAVGASRRPMHSIRQPSGNRTPQNDAINGAQALLQSLNAKNREYWDKQTRQQH